MSSPDPFSTQQVNNDLFSQRHSRQEYRERIDPSRTHNKGPLADPQGGFSGLLRQYGAGSTIHFGVVQSCHPYTRSYQVFTGHSAPVLCYRLGETGGTPLGVSDATTLQPNTPVFYIMPPNSHVGAILGVVPLLTSAAAFANSDTIGQGTNAGLNVDSAYQQPYFINDLSGGIRDFSSRTPVNSLELGEFCRVAETGLKIFLDAMMGTMHVDEATGIWMFYWDQLCRVAGVNYQLWTGGSETESYDDEGEHVWYEGIATFPWEQRGCCGGIPVPCMQSHDAQETQQGSPWLAAIEPAYDDQQAFHRWQTYRGYLGQGQKRLLTGLPLLEGGVEDVLRYSEQSYLPGLFAEDVTLAGHYLLRSSSSISLIKRPVITVPKRVKLPPDGTGDTAVNGNYSPSGVFGGAHKCVPSPMLKDNSDIPRANLIRMSSVADLHAYLFNWASLYPFAYHVRDFYTPEDNDATVVDSAGMYVPKAVDLQTKWILDPPVAIPVAITADSDKNAKVFPNTSYISLLEDGGVAIGDGFGAEIRMTGGSIRLSAPGDVFLDAGRDVIQWGGRDIVLRAKQSVDVTTTEKDIRLKAEQNVQSLAQTGGILLESRAAHPNYDFDGVGQAAKFTGIILKSTTSDIVGLAESIYLRTDLPNGAYNSNETATHSSDEEGVRKGNITLDAASGNRDVVTWSNFVKHYCHCNLVLAYVDEEQSGGSSQTIDSVVFNKVWVSPAGVTDSTQVEWANDKWNDDILTNWYWTDRPGDEDKLKQIWFSLRTDDDYKTDNFLIFEPRWAQLCRANGQTLEQWDEVKVDSMHGDSTDATRATYPFPGRKAFGKKVGSETQQKRYYTQDLVLCDASGQMAINRGSNYFDPEFASPTTNVLTTYPVIDAPAVTPP